MGDASVNGELPHLATVDHIVSYPVVKDTIDAFNSNPYGAKSVELTNNIYEKLVKPNLKYFETPAGYAKPYVLKIDEFGNLFLTKIDEKVPILKAETKEVKTAVIGYIHWPLEKANESKTYVFNTWGEEYKKCGGDGLVAGGKATITSSLVLTSDVLTWLSTYLSTKKAEVKEAAKEAQQKADE